MSDIKKMRIMMENVEDDEFIEEDDSTIPNEDRVGLPAINADGEEIPNSKVLSDYSYIYKEDDNVYVLSKVDPETEERTEIHLSEDEIEYLSAFEIKTDGDDEE